MKTLMLTKTHNLNNEITKIRKLIQKTKQNWKQKKQTERIDEKTFQM